MIDHRHTSASHPPANGLAERAVGTVKRALSKFCAEEGTQQEWDKHLPWLQLGYNASPQKATGFSPYQLMHAVTPVVPPAVREQLAEPMDFDDPEAAAADYLRRSRIVQQRCIIAGGNLLTAQHRDTLRYAKLRSGDYTPQLRRFLPLDYVYVQRHDKKGLDIMARKEILRVVEVRPSGVLIVQGRCGRCTAVHASRCSPCHLPNIDPTIDWSLGRPSAAAVCSHCSSSDEEQLGQLIFCNNCNDGYHLQCHNPALATKPRGTWICQPCQQQGITLEAVKAAQRISDQTAARQLQPEDLTAADRRAQAVHGRLLRKRFYSEQPGAARGHVQKMQWYIGKVYFRGPRQDSNLIVAYEDGDFEITSLSCLNAAGVEWLSEDAQIPAGVQFKTLEQVEQEYQSRVRYEELRQPHLQQRQIQQPQPPQAQTSQGHRQADTQQTATAPQQQQQPLRRSVRERRPTRAVLEGAAADSQPATIMGQGAAITIGAAAGFSEGAEIQFLSSPCRVWQQARAQMALPPYWALHTPEGLSLALQQLMPGDIAGTNVTQISTSIQRARNLVQAAPNRPEKPLLAMTPTDPAEVACLLNAVDFSGMSELFDPFAGSGGIAAAFAKAGYTVRQNDYDPFWQHPTRVDALQPANYGSIVYQAIITSPPFEVLDVAVPLVASKAAVVACVHVPGHWLSCPTAPRQRWLEALAAADRLHILLGLPRGAAGRTCAWTLIFASPTFKQQLLNNAATPFAMSYVPKCN
jgi:hypothetical protein